MKLIASKGWNQKRLQSVLNSFKETIETADLVGDKFIEINFVTDLCLTSFDETFTEVGDWNEIPPEYVLQIDFCAKTAKIKEV